jgi:FtsZ-binding cell division protein ZapB
MKADDQKKLNNLYRRYQNYDNDGTKYAFDIHFSTLAGERELKARRHTGVEKFREHIDALMQDFSDVCTITVTDYNGVNRRAQELNPPVTIQLLDVKSVEATPKVIVQGGGAQNSPTNGQATNNDTIFQGLAGLFVGTEYEGLGNIAPMAKLIDDRHVISRLQEKNDDRAREIDELKRKNAEWQQKYEALNGSFERLQDDAGDMEDELEHYRQRDRKQDKWVSVLGAAGASIAKNFIRQNPTILSGIIPPENLAGILSDEEPSQMAPPQSHLTDEEQSRMDDATIVFEWLQTLEAAIFSKVVTVIAAMRQNDEYTDRILAFLSNKLQVNK